MVAEQLLKKNRKIFNRFDVEDNLVVIMLMPSANRLNRDTLKVFRDAGGFIDFFPNEDNYPEQKEMLTKIPNLDYFGEDGEFFQLQIKTSLGNTLKLLKPLCYN